MSNSNTIKLSLGIFLPIAILLAVIGYIVIDKAKKSVGDLPELGSLPDFLLLSSDTTAYGRDDFKGKLSVVDFFFTRCKGPCPMMSANMAELYRQFEGHDEIQFVSITVDPETDSLAVMQAYAEGFGVTDKRWRFLTGDKDDIAQVCEGGFKLAADDLPGNHSTKFVLVDDRANIRGYYDGRDPAAMDILTTHIRSLAGQMK